MENHHEIRTATVLQNRLISSITATHHIDLAVSGFEFVPGQFISILNTRQFPQDHPRNGEARVDTHAYSLSSPPSAEGFSLTVNRVRTPAGPGYFSSYLCNLVPGATIRFHGPHGNFTLRENPTAPVLMLSEGSGIAPIRSILLSAPGTRAHLIQAAIDIPPLYIAEFSALPALQYEPVNLDSKHAASLDAAARALTADPTIRAAYIVGLSAFVNAHREQLKSLGWDRSQIIAERYD